MTGPVSHLARDLVENATLILALCFLYRLFVQRWPHPGTWHSVGLGLLFGLGAIGSMLIALEYQPGIILDGRTVMLSLGALHGGPVAAAISALLAAAYRIGVGGQGMPVGIMVIAAASGAGLVARAVLRPGGGRGWKLLLMGTLVHAVAIALFLLLPLPLHDRLLVEIAPPYLITLTLGTWVLGLLLADVDRYQHFDRLLRESRDRFQFLFQSTATALLDEDLSSVYRAVDQLRADGVTDLRAYLRDNPRTLSALIQRVKVRAANPAALELFGETAEPALKQGIDRHFAPDSTHIFLESLCAYWEGRDWLREETQLVRRDGTPFRALLAMPIPTDPESALHVPVNIIDVTPLRRRELELRTQQDYLEGVLWGTDAGTWEWHIPSDALRLNERWASLLGYGEDCPPPASFDARRQLIHLDDQFRSDRLLARVMAGEQGNYECELRLRKPDGSWRWMLERGKVTARDAQGTPVSLSGILMDIEARREAVDRAARLSTVRDALLYCHEELLGARTGLALFERTVHALVRTRGYRLAWIGEVRPRPGLPIDIVAQAGEAADLTDTLDTRLSSIPGSGLPGSGLPGSGLPGSGLPGSDQTVGHSPSRQAALSGEVQVVDDLTADPRDTPWKARAIQFNLRAAMIIPLRIDEGRTIILCLYSDVPGIFVDEERKLLEDFSRSLALALQALQTD